MLSIPGAANLLRDSSSEKLNASVVFPDRVLSQQELDSCSAIFLSLPFYEGLLYNPSTSTWMMGIRINKDVLELEGPECSGGGYCSRR